MVINYVANPKPCSESCTHLDYSLPDRASEKTTIRRSAKLSSTNYGCKDTDENILVIRLHSIKKWIYSTITYFITRRLHLVYHRKNSVAALIVDPIADELVLLRHLVRIRKYLKKNFLRNPKTQ